MKRQDALFRSAIQIHRLLSRYAQRQCDPFNQAAAQLMNAQVLVGLAWRRIEKAKRHDLHLTAQAIRPTLLTAVHALQAEVGRFLGQNAQVRRESTSPSLFTVIEELTQLQDEFEHVEILPEKGLIVAHTEPIELDEVMLGPFAIKLHVRRLENRTDSGCFDCTALDPNPAASNESVTHPHVQSSALCAGDATAAISHALKQGRINDAFCLIRSVLQTYNPHSPYVALDSWCGSPCPDCGCSVSDGDLCMCQACESSFCYECMSTCDICDQSICDDCLERDSVTRRRCCSGCRHTCDQCQRTVESGRFDPDTELCEDCAAETSEENEETEEKDPIDSEEQTQPF